MYWSGWTAVFGFNYRKIVRIRTKLCDMTHYQWVIGQMAVMRTDMTVYWLENHFLVFHGATWHLRPFQKYKLFRLAATLKWSFSFWHVRKQPDVLPQMILPLSSFVFWLNFIIWELILWHGCGGGITYTVFRGGLGMPGTLVSLGTRHAWNISKFWNTY